MLALLLFSIILLISFGLGAKLLRLAGIARLSKPQRGRDPFPLGEEFVFACSLGLGAIIYLLLVLGLFHLFYSWIFYLLVLGLAIFVQKDMIRLLSEFGRGLRKASRIRMGYATIALGLWFAVMVPLILFGVLAPASGFDWDSLAYHLAVPQIYLQHHHILSLPWMPHSNFPFAMEMLYTLGLGLQGQALAKLLNFGCGVLICAALLGWGNSFFGKGVGALAAAIFASIPLVFWESTVAYNELAFALFCLLSIWAWWKSSEEGAGTSRAWLLLSGVFGGLALATKMLAGFLAIFIIILALWDILKKQNPLSRLGTWILPALLIALPWYLKSYIWTGNPVYPFFYGLFDGRYWSAELAGQYSQAQAAFGMGHGLQWLLALPWTLTMYGFRFYDQPEPLRVFNMFITVIGPLFLAFLPWMLIKSFTNTLMRFLFFFITVAAICWFLLSAQTNRYLVPILAPLALMTGAVIIQMKGNPWLRRLAAAAVGLELIWGFATAIMLIGPQIPVAAGIEKQEDYLSRTLNIYPISRQINYSLPADAKIMLIGDTRGLYLEREYLWGPDQNNLIPAEEQKDPQSLLAALRGLGVTHLLLSPRTTRNLDFGQNNLDASLRALAAQHQIVPVLRDQGQGFEVFALAP